jgi:hypothetical protein
MGARKGLAARSNNLLSVKSWLSSHASLLSDTFYRRGALANRKILLRLTGGKYLEISTSVTVRDDDGDGDDDLIRCDFTGEWRF